MKNKSMPLEVKILFEGYDDELCQHQFSYQGIEPQSMQEHANLFRLRADEVQLGKNVVYKKVFDRAYRYGKRFGRELHYELYQK